MVILIDNYDSFTYNIAQYLGELGKDVDVYRHDEITIDELKTKKPTHIIISPGPKTPSEAGISKDVIKEFKGKAAILGVCLGHQCIGEVFGAKVIKAPELMHGKTSKIITDVTEPLFNEISNPFTATRYHSLIVDADSAKSTELDVIAWTSDNLVMGLRHKEYKNLIGVQFHPESILTEFGHQLLKNFLAM